MQSARRSKDGSDKPVGSSKDIDTIDQQNDQGIGLDGTGLEKVSSQNEDGEVEDKQ